MTNVGTTVSISSWTQEEPLWKVGLDFLCFWRLSACRLDATQPWITSLETLALPKGSTSGLFGWNPIHTWWKWELFLATRYRNCSTAPMMWPVQGKLHTLALMHVLHKKMAFQKSKLAASLVSVSTQGEPNQWKVWRIWWKQVVPLIPYY